MKYKCKLPFACKEGGFQQGQEVSEEIANAYPAYFEQLETKPDPKPTETKPKRARKPKTKKAE